MPENRSQPNNPHSAAASAYAQNSQKTTDDPRELEARVLMKSVARLQDLQSRWDSVKPEEMDDVLRYNRQIWIMFVDHAIEDKDEKRTQQLRNNIANLGAYVFKRTLEILASPEKEKLDVLIDINREIAAGLMTRPKAESGAN